MVIDVVCGILIDSEQGILVAQRDSSRAHGGLWEFPGGKLEPGESHEVALKRELDEELGIEIEVLPCALKSVDHEYPEVRVRMKPLVCRIVKNGQPELREHVGLQWKLPEGLASLEMPAADLPIAEEIRSIGSQILLGTF